MDTPPKKCRSHLFSSKFTKFHFVNLTSPEDKKELIENPKWEC